MTIGDWLVLAGIVCAFTLPTLGGVIHAVAKLSRINAKLDAQAQSMDEHSKNNLREHNAMWDGIKRNTDRLGDHVVGVSERLATLEAGQE